MTETSSPYPIAGVPRRLAAMVYDSLLVFGVLFTATIPALFWDHQKRVGNDEVVHEITPIVEGIYFQLYLLLVVIAFFCWFWKKNGQTLGMQAWRLLLVADTGADVAVRQCLIRLLAAALSLLCFGLGYWWAWIDKEKLTWHDRLSKTRVVLLPKKSSTTAPS